jgi:hypothetical protein
LANRQLRNSHRQGEMSKKEEIIDFLWDLKVLGFMWLKKAHLMTVIFKFEIFTWSQLHFIIVFKFKKFID